MKSELQKELDRFKALKEQATGDTAWIDKTIADLESQLGIFQERAQKQAEDLEDIVLPQDYNEIFGDPRANDEIQSIIRQVKEQLWSRHNEDLSDLDAQYRAQVAELNQSLTLLQSDKESLAAANADLAQQMDDAHATIHALTERAEDAEKKRDAAAREIASLKGQIDELEQSITVQKKPAKNTGFTFSLTSNIKMETPEEKAARLKREEVERINANLARMGVEPLKIPSDDDIKNQFQKVEEAAQEAAKFPAVVQSDAAGQGTEGGATENATDASIPPQTLEERVIALEKAVFGKINEGAA